MDPLRREQLTTDGTAVVVVIDVDKFHAVNHVHGYSVGDEVLASTEARLRSAFGADAMLERFRDTFTVILPTPAHPSVLQMATEALGSISEPVGTHEVRLTASIGIGRTLRGGELEAYILGEQAMQRAKREGRARICAQPEE